MKILTFSIKKNLFNIACIIFVISLVLFSVSNLSAAKSGLYLWANNIIPALFPFFVATELLSHTPIINVLGNFFNKFMRPIFNVPGQGSFPLIMGILSGYPIGAKIVCDMRNSNVLTKSESERLLSFTNNSGPLFILGTIGIVLLITHILASLIVGIIFRFWKYKDTNIASSKTTYKSPVNNSSNIGEILSSSIKNSIFTILNIGGFIVFFSVIISIFNNILIFTEVKTRLSKEYGFPFESVTKSKQKNIKKLASYYIYFYKFKNYYVRFDVAEVYLNNLDNSYKINIIEDAFR